MYFIPECFIDLCHIPVYFMTSYSFTLIL